jgi:putative tryptophan/tyrosine transport system substrate-binding protein
MRRREFIKAIGGTAAAWPFAARAQQRAVRRIGIMMSLPESDPEGQRRFNAIRDELQTRGWSEASNLRIDVRWATGTALARQQAVAKELIDLQPDLIMVQSTTAATAVVQVSPSTPIVFVQITDPVGQGFVASLARPGGNITGFSNFESLIGGKWLQLLKEIAPQVSSVAMLYNPDTAPYYRMYLQSIETAAHSFSMSVAAIAVRSPGEIESALTSVSGKAGQGLVIPPDSFTTNHRKLINDLAARHRLPAIYTFRYQAEDGGLISYGPETIALFRQATSYIDRVLKGEKPADLPVQQPTKYELVINLKTAKALGLDVPLLLQQRADEVIE